MISRELLKKYGITDTSNLEEKDGKFDLTQSLDAIVKHVQSMAKQNPDTVKEAKEQGVKEGRIEATKTILKRFKDAYKLDLTNSDLSEGGADLVLEKLKEHTDFIAIDNKKSNDEKITALQAQLDELSSKNETLQAEKEAELLALRNEYQAKETSAKFNSHLLSEIAKTKYVVSPDTVLTVFQSKFSQNGYKAQISEKGEIEIVNSEGQRVLNQNGTSFVTTENLLNEFTQDLVQKSNGASGGGATTVTPSENESDYMAQKKAKYARIGG